MKFSTKWLIPIGIVLFICIVWKAGITSIAGAIKDVNGYFLVASLVAAIPVVLIKSLKWRIVLAAHGEKTSFSNAIKVWLVGLFGETVTPARIGMILRAFYYKDRIRALSAATVDRILEVIVLLFMGAAGIFLTIFWFGGKTYLFLLLLLFFLALPPVIYVLSRRKWVKKFAAPLYKIFIPERHKEKVRLSFEGFYDNLEFALKKRRRALLVAALVGFTGWLAAIFQGWLIVLAFRVEVSYFVMLAFTPIITLIQIVPITISGFGTREATAVFLFSLLGVPAATVVAFSIIFWIFGMMILGSIGLVLFILNPIKLEL